MYENGKTYEGEYAGVKIRFSLQNFSQNVVDRFNKELVKRAMEETVCEGQKQLNA